MYADGAIEGNPFLDAHFECHQHEDVDCEDASIADVINEMTGTQLTDENIVAEASHQTSSIPDPTTGAPRPMYDPANGGSHLQDAPALFAPHGVHAVYTDDQVAQQGGPASGMDALEQNLAAGDHELVAVDGEMVWDNAIGDAHTAADHDRADHIVTVTGIDTANGYVYLNDTGSHDQSTEQVPLDKFEDAWALSGHAMVSTDPTHATDPDPLAAPGPIPATPAADPFTAVVPTHIPDASSPGGPAVAPVTPSAATTSYTVAPGDDLWDIAERVYGDPSQFHRIADASGIVNPSLIIPGEVLTIPA
jgi:hypothetical protein